MFSEFYKKPFFVKQPLRDFILQTTNESIKRQIDFKEKHKFQKFVTSSFASLNDNNDPKRPNDDNDIPYIIGFLSLSSIFYYFFFKKR